MRIIRVWLAALLMLYGVVLGTAHGQQYYPGPGPNPLPGGPPTGVAGGDLGGSYPSPTVTGGSHLTGTLGTGLVIPSPSVTAPTLSDTITMVPGATITGQGGPLTTLLTFDNGGTLIDASSYARSVLRLRTDLDRIDGIANDQFGLVIQANIPATASTLSYEKFAALFWAKTADPSGATDRDAGGSDNRGECKTGVVTCRIWGSVHLTTFPAGSDGHGAVAELDALNYATADQDAPFTATSKIGLVISASGTQNTTSAITIQGSGVVFHKGLYAPQNAIGSAANDRFIQLDTIGLGTGFLFDVKNTGDVHTAGTLTAEGNSYFGTTGAGSTGCGFRFRVGTNENLCVLPPSAVAGAARLVVVTDAGALAPLEVQSAATFTNGVTLTGATSGGTALQASAIASGTLTLPAATDTLVGRATTDTLTNKTLTAPVLGGTVTGTYTLAGIITLPAPGPFGDTTSVVLGTGAGAAQNTNTINNVIIGNGAGALITSYRDSVIIGAGAGAALTSPGSNPESVYVGRQAGAANTSGGFNVFLGYKAGFANTSGAESTCIGWQSCAASQTPGFAVAVGTSTFLTFAGTTSPGVAVGVDAAKFFNVTSGGIGVAMGNNAAKNMGGGGASVYIGDGAAQNWTIPGSTGTFNQNTVLGNSAFAGPGGGGAALSQVWKNVAIGNGAMGSGSAATGMAENVAIGYFPMTSLTSGNKNIGIGTNAGNSITSGTNNVTIGYQVGSANLTTGSNVVAIGTTAAVLPANTSNAIYIGTSSTCIICATGGDVPSTSFTTIAGVAKISGGFTVSALPATAGAGAVVGARTYVTDAVACTFLGALTGGSSTFCPVVYNGSAWVEGWLTNRDLAPVSNDNHPVGVLHAA